MKGRINTLENDSHNGIIIAAFRFRYPLIMNEEVFKSHILTRRLHRKLDNACEGKRGRSGALLVQNARSDLP